MTPRRPSPFLLDFDYDPPPEVMDRVRRRIGMRALAKEQTAMRREQEVEAGRRAALAADVSRRAGRPVAFETGVRFTARDLDAARRMFGGRTPVFNDAKPGDPFTLDHLLSIGVEPEEIPEFIREVSASEPAAQTNPDQLPHREAPAGPGNRGAGIIGLSGKEGGLAEVDSDAPSLIQDEELLDAQVDVWSDSLTPWERPSSTKAQDGQDTGALLTEAMQRARASLARPQRGVMAAPSDELDRIAEILVRTNGGIDHAEVDRLLDAFDREAAADGASNAWRTLLRQLGGFERPTDPSPDLGIIQVGGRSTTPRRAQPESQQNLITARKVIHSIRQIDPTFKYLVIRRRQSKFYTQRDVTRLKEVLKVAEAAHFWRQEILRLSPGAKLAPLRIWKLRQQMEQDVVILRNTPSFTNSNRSVINPYYTGLLQRPTARNHQLSKIYRELWRDGDMLPGGTASMLRWEVARGVKRKHETKVQERIDQLRHFLGASHGQLSRRDRAQAERVLNDLREALRFSKVRPE